MSNNKAIAAYVQTCLSLTGKVKKDGTNPHFKSGYATLESVLDTILPSCHENKLVPMQEIIAADNGISVKTTLFHESGDSMVMEACPIPVDKNNAHGVVSSSTYGRRVSLMAIFGLAPSDDDGNAAVSAPPPPDEEAVEALTIAANEGLEEFRKAWKKLPAERRKTITPELQAQFKALTEKVSDNG